jgi:hypothetical protein
MSQSKGTFSWEDEYDKNGSALDFEIEYFGNLWSWDFYKDWDEEHISGESRNRSDGWRRKEER